MAYGGCWPRSQSQYCGAECRRRPLGQAARHLLDRLRGRRSTLIVTPAGESVLIDNGNPGAATRSGIHKGAAEVAGLKQIDYLVTTKPFDTSAAARAVTAHPDQERLRQRGIRRREGQQGVPPVQGDKRLVLNPGDAIPLKRPRVRPRSR